MFLILILFLSNIIFSQCAGFISTDANPSNISPGDAAKIIYLLTNNGTPCISAINIDISFDSSIFNPPEISCGSASSSAGKVCQGNLISAGNYRVIIYGGITTISNGEILKANFKSLSSANYGSTIISCTSTASDPDGNPVQITNCRSVTIQISPPALSCNAEANPASGDAPLTVNFTSSASGGVPGYSFYWEFGDGGKSNEQNPVHTYTEAGIYNWQVNIKDSQNQNCQRNGQIISGLLQCEAKAEPDEGYAPLDVQFTSSYIGGKAPYNFYWEFGDGGESQEQNPKHRYQNTGKYDWKITIRDGTSQSCTKEGEIKVIEKVYFKYFIPASANSKGAYGTNWKSDLVIYNKDNQEVSVMLYFLEAGKDNLNSEGKNITVGAGNAYKIMDIVKSLFGKENISGGIKILSDKVLAITSRTYNDKGEGTYGQFIRSYKEEDCLRGGEEGILIQLTKNLNFRTNIGFLNTKEKNTILNLTLYKEDGSFIGSKEYNLKPLEYFQENNILQIFTEENIDNFFAKIKVIDGNAFVYASVVDNRTGDAIFIPLIK